MATLELDDTEGLAKFERGLFNEEGRAAGSGYHCTKDGADWIGQHGVHPEVEL